MVGRLGVRPPEGNGWSHFTRKHWDLKQVQGDPKKFRLTSPVRVDTVGIEVTNFCLSDIHMCGIKMAIPNGI